MATHPVFCSKIPWTEEPHDYRTAWMQELGHDLDINHHCHDLNIGAINIGPEQTP